MRADGDEDKGMMTVEAKYARANTWATTAGFGYISVDEGIERALIL